MTEVDLIGRILKAIASTPHRGADEAQYQRVVVEPARALRRRWEEGMGGRPVRGDCLDWRCWVPCAGCGVSRVAKGMSL